jgi:flavin reductase (DIM6/NTAB) family NADH-FMN oxidoreductase RutF
MVSGAKTDKAKDCGFTIFYGTLKNAPLIEQCPVNLECKVMHLLNIGAHMLVVGEIIQTHVTEECLTGDEPDIMKIKPFVYSRALTTRRYNAIGKVIGLPYEVGKKLKKLYRR